MTSVAARAPLAPAVRSAVMGFALWLAAALIAGFTLWRYLEYFDEGLLLQAASRVAAGQWPYADFGWSYGPGQPVLGALAFELLGRSVLWWRFLWVAAVASAAVLGWDLVRRTAGPRWALAAWAAVALTLAQPATANPTPPALALALAAVAVAAAGREPTTARAATAGALAALTAAWRLDFGVTAAAAVVVTLALRTQAARPSRAGGVRRSSQARRAGEVLGAGAARRSSHAWPAVGVFVAATALVYLPFAVVAGPGDLWDALVASSAGDGEWWSLPFPWLYDGPLRGAADAKDALAYQLPLLVLVTLAVAGVAFVRARRLPPAAGGLAVLALGSVAYFLSRADELHAQPLIAVAAILATMAAGLAGRRTAAVLAALVALVIVAGAANRGSALLRPPDLEPVRLDGVPGIRVPPAEARALPALAAEVDRLVPPGRPIYVAPRRSDLVTSTAPLVHFLVDRPNVLRRDVLLQARAEEQERIVAVLRGAPAGGRAVDRPGLVGAGAEPARPAERVAGAG